MTLRETLEQLPQVPQSSMNEATTRSSMIEPVLEALGWNKMRAEVQLEYKVHGRGQNSTGFVDVALLAEPTSPSVFVEVKKANTALKEDHADQVLEYAFKKNVPFSVVTNGADWWLYLSERGRETRFAKFRLHKDDIDQVETNLEAFLGRDAVTNGSAQARARKYLDVIQEQVRLNEAVPRIWFEMLGELDGTGPDADLLDLIKRRVYEETGLGAESEHIAAVIKGQSSTSPLASSLRSASNLSSDTAPASTSVAGRPEEREPRAKAISINGYQLWNKYKEVTNNYELLTEVCLDIYNDGHSHDFELIKEPLGRGRPYASRQPEELDPSGTREAMRRPVGKTGWYVNANLTHHNLEKRSRLFLKRFKYNPNDLKVYRAGESPLTEASWSRSGNRQQGLPTGLIGFKLWDQHCTAKYYYEIARAVAEGIYRRNPADFQRAETLGGSILSKDPDAFKNSEQVAESGWYVDVSRKGRKHVRDAEKLLEHFDYKPDDLDVS